MASTTSSNGRERPVTIVLADDHRVVRTGIRLLLEREPGFAVAAEADDSDAALDAVLAHRPAVLVFDLNMPGAMTSMEAIAAIRDRAPATAVVVLTMQEDPAFARDALRAGARAYVLKDAADADLVEAIRRAAAGEGYVAPKVGAVLGAAPPEQPSGPTVELTAREAEVLRLIALGHTNAETGELLELSVRTIESHRAHIQRKLRRTSRAELVRYALDHKMVAADRRPAV
jgi:two-component system response regulator NreC